MRATLVLALGALLSGCAAVGSLAGLAGGLGLASSAAAPLSSAALARAPGQASNTVHHGDAPVRAVCIELNRNVPLADLVPALQAELREQRVTSRVYEAGTELLGCEVWLRYAASVAWAQPPFSERYRPYLSAASLSLRKADGTVMASSDYQLDEDMGLSRWADTRHKLARTVYALVTGFEN